MNETREQATATNRGEGRSPAKIIANGMRMHLREMQDANERRDAGEPITPEEVARLKRNQEVLLRLSEKRAKQHHETRGAAV